MLFAYFYSVAPLYIFKSSVVKFCLFRHYDAMLLHHCAYVRVHSCCLYFFTQYNVNLSHRGACVSVDLSSYGSSFTHYTAMHQCAYDDMKALIWPVQFLLHCCFTLMQCSSPLCVCKSSVVLLLFFFIPMHYPHRPLVLLYLIETVCMLDGFRCFRCCITSVSCCSFTHSNALPMSTIAIIFRWHCVLCIATPPCFEFCCSGGFDSV